MKTTAQQTKTLNQILNKDDILTRFRLLQLWMLDIFSQSLNSPNSQTIDMKAIIDTLMAENINEASDVETIYAALNNVKKNIQDINNKLKQTCDQIKHQRFISNILQQILKEEGIEANDGYAKHVEELEKLIKTNEERIQHLQDMSQAQIQALIAPSSGEA